ncbi:MAG TPA: hypothetical protein VFQ05_08690 [Candidatus Eisenbacteria bacterium]|nr:hypothetical protein [Candidatus Eisenbacteria bacterium]
MKRLALMLLLLASTLLIGLAEAAPAPQVISKLARTSIVAPPEWDGYWTTVDSIYTCEGGLMNASPGADTICGGKDYAQTPPGSTLQLVCTGNADATTIDVTCTGSGQVDVDCFAEYTVVTHSTRTADTYFTVSTINIVYSGAGCPVPPQCIQVNSHGTRTGAAPPDFCATATKKTTWGQIKALYR